MASRIDQVFGEICRSIRPLRKFIDLIRDRREMNEIPTAAIMVDKNRTNSSDNYFLAYNKKFIETCDDQKLKFVLAHELSHVLLRHLQRYNTHIGESSQQKMVLFNIIADAYINEFLLTKHLVPDSVISEGVFFPKLAKMGVSRDDFESKNCEEIFDMLWDDELEEENSIFIISNGNNENNSSNNSSSQSSSNGSSVEEANISEVKNQIDDAIKRDVYKIEIENRNYIYDSEEIGERREFELFNLELDWEDKVTDMINEIGFLPPRIRSNKRVNKRYRDVYPHSKGYYKSGVKNIVVAIDTSGSMNPEKINKVVNLVNNLSNTNSVEFNYYFFTHETYELHTFTNFEIFKNNLCGVPSGGTEWNAAIEYITEETDGAIIISDMKFAGFSLQDVKDEVEQLPVQTILINVDEVRL